MISWSGWKTDWLERLDYFKIYDVINWLTNNCNTHIDRFLKKQRQSDTEIWLVIENHIRNIFLEFPDPFLKNQNWAYLWINSRKFYTIYFYWMTNGNIFKLSYRLLAFSWYKAFKKNKKRSVTSFPNSFSAWFLKKNISLVIFYYLSKFYFLVAFTSWDIG